MRKVNRLFILMVLSIFPGSFTNTAEAAIATYSEKSTIGIAAEDLSHGSNFGSKAYRNTDEKSIES